jgi:hypothetical protein
MSFANICGLYLSYINKMKQGLDAMNNRDTELMMKQIEDMKKSASDLRDQLISMANNPDVENDTRITMNYDISRSLGTTSKKGILQELDKRVWYVESILDAYDDDKIKLQTPESARLGLAMLYDQFNSEVAEPCKMVGIPVERWGEQEKINDLVDLLKVISDGISRKTGHDNFIRRCILDGEKNQETSENVFVNIVTHTASKANEDTQKMFSLTSGDEYRKLCKDLMPLTQNTKLETLEKVSRKIENDFQEAAQRAVIKRKP